MGLLDIIGLASAGRLSRPPKEERQDGASAGAVGITARAAGAAVRNEQIRSGYNGAVSALDPSDNAARETLKAVWRKRMPAEMRSAIKKARPDLGPRQGSVGRANATNPRATNAARNLGRVGRGVGAVGAGLAAADIAASDNKPRAGVANVGATGGGWAGGLAGAEAGATIYPPWGALFGGLLGALAGGNIGYEAGQGAYDAVQQPKNPARVAPSAAARMVLGRLSPC